jgi:hypothetical protein
MGDYFSEKAQQVDPNSLIAFGIKVSSRYGKADEICAMINFAREAAISKVNSYVKSIFYDSKAAICNFELSDSVKRGDPVEQLLYKAARSNIDNFLWFEEIECSIQRENEFGTSTLFDPVRKMR